MFNYLKSLALKLVRKYFFNNVIIRKGVIVVDSKMEEYVQLSNYSTVQKSNIGAYTSVGRYSNLTNVEIGKFCSIARNVTIGATQHYKNHLSTHAFSYIRLFDFVKEDQKIAVTTRVGNDVWFGANCVVMPGVSVGDGAIIGASAVVTGDVEPYSIVVGIPAKKIGYRFEETIIQALLKIKWWNWSRDKISKNLELFRQELTLDIIENIRNAELA